MKDFMNDVRRRFGTIKNGKFSRNDLRTVQNNYDEILQKSSQGPLSEFFDDIQTLCEMVAAWAKKKYTKIPVKTIGMIILSLAYVFSPVDIIPDFIPVAGLLDDAAVVGLCIAAARSDINEFRLWKRHRR